MNTNYSEIADPEDVIDQGIAAVETLDTIVSDIDRFVLDWAQRLQQQLEVEDKTPKPDQRLRRQIEQFENEKSEWRLKRDQENERINEKLEQLADAWLHLEAEQRQFLQLKQNVHVQSIEVTQQPQVSAGTDDVASASALASTSPRCVDAQEPLATSSKLQDPITAETAVRQFQRLRQEILSSRRR